MEMLTVANNFFFKYSSTVHLTRRLCRPSAVMNFSFADAKLQTVQCLTQKYHEVKKRSLQSLLMGEHLAL